MYRIGQGYDSHAFTIGNHIWLGGVKIPFERGIRAHSDGDVLLHALSDACLGALALGDIGQLFPDTDPALKNISSELILQKVMQYLAENGYKINNLDATIITEAPKLAPYIAPIRTKLSSLLAIEADCISVKATTNERMGWIGRAEGIAVMCVVLLVNG